jgi:hypothetical protein
MCVLDVVSYPTNGFPNNSKFSGGVQKKVLHQRATRCICFRRDDGAMSFFEDLWCSGFPGLHQGSSTKFAIANKAQTKR